VYAQGVYVASFAGFLPASDRLDRLGGRFRLERGLLFGLVVFLAGLAAAAISLVRWHAKKFGPLDADAQLRVVVPATLGLVLGSWIVLSSFFLSILGLDKEIRLE